MLSELIQRYEQAVSCKECVERIPASMQIFCRYPWLLDALSIWLLTFVILTPLMVRSKSKKSRLLIVLGGTLAVIGATFALGILTNTQCWVIRFLKML